MKLFKFDHACFAVEINGHVVVVDPGSLTPALTFEHASIDAVVITHIHSDHVNEQHLEALRARSPDLVILATQEVADALPSYNITAVQPHDTRTIGAFSLTFGGGTHATIHPDITPVQNISVLVNDIVYYPGDSFAPAPQPVRAVLAPAAAPWLKISEAIDFIRETEADYIIPTHDAILSEQGKQIHDNMLRKAAEDTGKEYIRLASGDSITI